MLIGRFNPGRRQDSPASIGSTRSSSPMRARRKRASMHSSRRCRAMPSRRIASWHGPCRIWRRGAADSPGMRLDDGLARRSHGPEHLAPQGYHSHGGPQVTYPGVQAGKAKIAVARAPWGLHLTVRGIGTRSSGAVLMCRAWQEQWMGRPRRRSRATPSNEPAQRKEGFEVGARTGRSCYIRGIAQPLGLRRHFGGDHVS